ncbi:MAG: hypothetical protein HY282_02740 [Nitrospirae bacterium]|nr:hypothetical protein [Candidatus Manganitrophaceae bacterium]
MTHSPPLRGKGILLCCLLIAVLSGCASLSPSRHEGTARIEIASPGIGGGLELFPSLVTIAPGEKVSWHNQTTYDLQINIDPDESSEKRPAFISHNATVETVFAEPGTYSYTLFFSSAKTFGQATGKIVVEDPNRRPAPSDRDRERPPQERIPDSEPYIL